MQPGDLILFDRFRWRILSLEDHRVLLLTEDIVLQRPYHNRPGGVTWAECELRCHLNGPFYRAFEETNRSRILPAVHHTPANPWYGSDGGADTRDFLFLLSLEEVVCNYFGDSRRNLENRSPKQRYWFQKKDANNPKRAADFDGYGWWWWLRTPGRDNRRAVYIHGDGNIGIQGNGTHRYSSNTLHPHTGDNSGGVRPALWLKL